MLCLPNVDVSYCFNKSHTVPYSSVILSRVLQLVSIYNNTTFNTLSIVGFVLFPSCTTGKYILTAQYFTAKLANLCILSRQFCGEVLCRQNVLASCA